VDSSEVVSEKYCSNSVFHSRPPSGRSETLGRRLWRHLREAGVCALYGDAGAGRVGLPVTAEVPATVAPTLAAAHARVHRRTAATWCDGVLSVGEPTGEPFVVDSAAALHDAVAAGALRPGGALRVDVELDRPAGPWRPPAPPPAATSEIGPLVERLAAAVRPVVLAGPGVVAAVPGLHALATAGRLGVLNTWGAKGVFPWRSLHHWATIGLQRDDFALGGLGEADLIVAVGLDPDESPAERWQLAEYLIVPPEALGDLALAWRRDREPEPVPRLRELLAAATQRGWAVDRAPLPPSRVTLAYGEVVASRGGLVAADPGTAGFWVARTVATTVLDSVVVPAARVAPGFAVACAIVARLAGPSRPALAVVDGPVDERTAELHELSAALGVPVPVEVWLPDGPRLDAAAHADRLAEAVHAEVAGELPLAVAQDRMADMVDAAGPVVAWDGGAR
jgi:Thiamine pyrophosphate enzyme, central domain